MPPKPKPPTYLDVAGRVIPKTKRSFYPVIAPTLTRFSQKLNFDPARDLDHQVMRPCAEDALKHPSRVNNELHYRNGRVETMKGIAA